MPPQTAKTKVDLWRERSEPQKGMVSRQIKGRQVCFAQVTFWAWTIPTWMRMDEDFALITRLESALWPLMEVKCPPGWHLCCRRNCNAPHSERDYDGKMK